MENFNIDKNGFYGNFGGAFVPKELEHNIEELKNSYLKIIESEKFQKEYHKLLRDYVGRPSPLYYAKNLSQHYGAKIYLKREDLNHTGAHKINNVIGQILIAKTMGKTKIIAETGAGQHGVATATACALMGMECVVFMGRVDILRQELNVKKMEMLGAKVVSVERGTKTLKEAVDCALEYWSQNPESFYLLGSAVGPHPYPDMVARLQAVISKEIKEQLLEKEDRECPDRLVACVGGGSNAAGTVYHYLDEKDVKITLAEAGGLGTDTNKHAATMLLGTEGEIHGFKTLIIKDKEGKIAEPYSISAGLDYPGVGPMHANLAHSGRAEVIAITDKQAIEAAFLITGLEGIIPAIESAHALAALNKIKFLENEIVVVTVSGRGDKDMPTYIANM